MTTTLILVFAFALVWLEPLRRYRARRDRGRCDWARQRDALRRASEQSR